MQYVAVAAEVIDAFRTLHRWPWIDPSIRGELAALLRVLTVDTAGQITVRASLVRELPPEDDQE